MILNKYFNALPQPLHHTSRATKIFRYFLEISADFKMGLQEIIEQNAKPILYVQVLSLVCVLTYAKGPPQPKSEDTSSFIFFRVDIFFAVSVLPFLFLLETAFQTHCQSMVAIYRQDGLCRLEESYEYLLSRERKKREKKRCIF